MGKLLDLDGYQAVSAELKKYIDSHDAQIDSFFYKKTYLEFPTVGDQNVLYIDTTANEIYRWDDNSIKYYCIGTDFHNIKVISGGNSII